MHGGRIRCKGRAGFVAKGPDSSQKDTERAILQPIRCKGRAGFIAKGPRKSHLATNQGRIQGEGGRIRCTKGSGSLHERAGFVAKEGAGLVARERPATNELRFKDL